jgi:DNA-binding CsgD family transcriptional regulator
MKATKSLPDLLFKHQLKLEYFGLFLLVFAVSINLDEIRTGKPWDDIYFDIMIPTVIAIFITSIWMRLQKSRTRSLAREIKRTVVPKGAQRDAMVAKLSTRQKEIFELILLKMSNKEIMEELSIEQTSLRSHISKIYKILQRARRADVAKSDQ